MADPREWWTAAEIAEAGLPDLPGTRQGVNAMTERLGWPADPKRARRRKGRGGGWEYHKSLFPLRAQKALLPTKAKVPNQPGRDEAWQWFEGLPDRVKSRAVERLAVIQQVETLEAYTGKFLAVAEVARLRGVSARTIWNWFSMIEGVRADDRLPYVVPRNRAAKRKTGHAVDPDFGRLIKADWLRLSGPSLTSAYDRACRLAGAEGIEVAPIHTVRRWLKTEISKATEVLARKGAEALKQLYPAQERDKTALRPMEVVNADFHRFDVFVRWPAEPGETEGRIERPQLVAFQDVFSGRLLCWRIDRTPNAQAVQLAIGDMIEAWGIPEHVLLDNGREFAAKAITGGTRTRYRFKVKEDDIDGLLVTLGCEVIWATPYSGQSKPIERAFRDLCDRVAKHPAFQGAYTGNRPEAKPEDYGSRAVDLDAFLKVLSEEIEAHNLRRGRRSEVAWGRSFAEVFDEAYATAPIRKATAEQRRLWLMGAEGLRVNSRNGQLVFQKNRYWDNFLHDHMGEKVVVRFDPAALWDGVHVYALGGEYLGHAPCIEKVGFLDIAEGRRHARARTQWIRAEKEALAAHRRMTAAELGDALTDLPSAAPAAPVEAKVVRPVMGNRARRADQPAANPALDAAQSAVILDLERARSEPTPEDEMDRFRRALELEAATAGGRDLTDEQRRWLRIYQDTPEYRGHRQMLEDFGEGYLAG